MFLCSIIKITCALQLRSWFFTVGWLRGAPIWDYTYLGGIQLLGSIYECTGGNPMQFTYVETVDPHLAVLRVFPRKLSQDINSLRSYCHWCMGSLSGSKLRCITEKCHHSCTSSVTPNRVCKTSRHLNSYSAVWLPVSLSYFQQLSGPTLTPYIEIQHESWLSC